jgi:hypothetical protein
MFIPDADFCPSRIPDPKTATKEKGEKICCPTFFCSHKYQKIETYYIFELVKKKKFGPIYKELKKFLPKKLSLRSQKYGWRFRIRDPESGKNLFRIPDSGVKKAPDPGSGSATLLWASVVCGCQGRCRHKHGLPLTILFCPEYLVNTYSTK